MLVNQFNNFNTGFGLTFGNTNCWSCQNNGWNNGWGYNNGWNNNGWNNNGYWNNGYNNNGNWNNGNWNNGYYNNYPSCNSLLYGAGLGLGLYYLLN